MFTSCEYPAMIIGKSMRKRIRDAALLASFSSITFAAKKQKSQNNDSSRTI